MFIRVDGFMSKLNSSFVYLGNLIWTNFNEKMIKSLVNSEFETLPNIFSNKSL